MRPRVTVRHVSKTYGSRRVLDDVSFGCAGGQVTGLIGPNGAGKTTMLRTIVGLLHPDAGAVLLEGLELPAALARTRVAYCAGGSTLPGSVRVGRWFRLFQSTYDGPEISRRVRVLSRGSRQMLGLRAALAVAPPELVVLDEPWEGLDPDGARWLTDSIRLLRRGGACLIVSSHRLHDLVDVCDRYLFLDRGVATPLEAHHRDGGARPSVEALYSAFDALRGTRT